MIKLKEINKAFSSIENNQTKPAIEPLFDESCLDFKTLVKNDPELEGLDANELKEKTDCQPYPLLDDNLWNNDENEEDNEPQKEEVEFYAKKLENASETDIKSIIHIIDDRFQIENEESQIGIAAFILKILNLLIV